MRVLVSGYLGFGNLGDEALFSGLARGLEARGHRVVALSGDPAATREAHGVDAVHRLRGLPGAIARADAVLSGGGGLLQDATSARSLGYYLAVLRLARLLRKRTVVYGQSIGPLSAEGRTRARDALRGVPLFVRDRASVALLDELGLASELVADTALLLPDPPRTGAGGPLLLIPRAGVAGATEALVRVAREARDAGERVATLALQPGPDEEDADRVAGAAPGVERWRATDPDAALARCAEAGFVVSVRLHGLILALRAGRGHVGIDYDPKVAGFLAESGAPAVRVPVDEEALARVVRARPALDRARRDALLARAEAGLDRLHAALSEPAGDRHDPRASPDRAPRR